MTNELEKKFFDTFGIEERCILERYCDNCTKCACLHYPRITPEILLELICVLTKRYDYADQNWLTKCNDIEELKVSVLRLLLLCTSSTIEKYKDQVRTLFEEG